MTKKFEIYCSSCKKMTDVSMYVNNEDDFKELESNPAYMCEKCFYATPDISPLEFDCKCALACQYQ